MPQHIEHISTGTTTQTAQHLDMLKEQKRRLPFEEQRATRNARFLVQSRNEVSLPLSHTEAQQRSATETHAYGQELDKRVHEINGLIMEHAKLPPGAEVAMTQQMTELSQRIIEANEKEVNREEPRFQELKSKVTLLQKEQAEIRQQIEELETYRQSFEQAKSASSETHAITYPLKKQVELLDTAITALRAEHGSHQTPTESQRIQEFEAQKQRYEDKRKSHVRKDARLPALDKQLAETEVLLQQHESELQQIKQRIEEIETERGNIQKAIKSPHLVSQNFTTQLSMAEANVSHLEREIGKQQNGSQILPTHDATSTVADLTKSQRGVQDTPMTAELTTLQKQLATEQAYIKELRLGMEERVNQNIVIELRVDDELRITLAEITSLQKINTLFKKEKNLWQKINPDDKATLQKIDQHLTQNTNLLEEAKDNKETLEDCMHSYQHIITSAEAQRNGIYSAEEIESKEQNLTVKMLSEVRKEIIDEKINSMEEQLKTLDHLWNEQASLQNTGKANSNSHKYAEHRAHIDKLSAACQKQLDAIQDQRASLTESTEPHATSTTVSRPIDAQLDMIKNLRQQSEQDKSDREPIEGLEKQQRKLEELHSRQEEMHRTTSTRLDKQVDMVKDHIGLLQKEAKQLKRSERGKIKAQIATEKASLQRFETMPDSKHSLQTMVTQDAQQQRNMLDNLLKGLQTKRTDLQKALQQTQQHRESLQQKIKDTSSDHIPITSTWETQRELIDINLKYLRTQNESSTKQLEMHETEKEHARVKLTLLADCNDLLARNESSNIVTRSNYLQSHLWSTYKQSLQAELKKRQTEVNELQPDASTEKHPELKTHQDRMQAIEKLEKEMSVFKKNIRDIGTAQQAQELSYVEKLDQQRDHIQHIAKKAEATVIQDARRLLKHLNSYKKRYFIHEKKKVQKLEEKKADIKKQLVSSRATHDDIREQLNGINDEIQFAHERLKDIAESKGESKHLYFLNEHMIPHDLLVKFGFAPVLRSQILKGTDESACLPTSTRMICHDKDPSFINKAKEVAAAYYVYGNGGTKIKDGPEALKKLGHPVPYTSAGIYSMRDMLNRITFDKYGQCAPFIINIHRPEKPVVSAHAVVCDSIIHLNQHDYAVIRDPNERSAFAVRLEHLDEVLVKYDDDEQGSEETEGAAPLRHNVLYALPSQN